MRALITGITGQDGSYLTELLLTKGYEVHGLVRPGRELSQSRLTHLVADPSFSRRLVFHEAGFDDAEKLNRVLAETPFDEVYHLAAQSHVGLSFEKVEATCEIAVMGTVRLLEAIRKSGHRTRLFNAASSEMFGLPKSAPQTEETPRNPINPYGCAKTFAFDIVTAYRQRLGLFASNGILFNHESPRRGENFVTKKICLGAAAIKLRRQEKLTLGSLDARRDWGDARDFVRGMWLTLQHTQPDDFIFATGELHSVQDVVEIAFETVKLNWRDYVEQDTRFIRPAEPTQLVGNPAKAERVLGWKRNGTFQALIAEMTESAIESLRF
ncbi:MAG TPA: GDP-mannose 4,6-dehydratase [Candidatus Paceibacterota bacterium]|nr:GDP-mannose 4,6-dehydratase [Candidatus Paceibacterota bacterium]